MFRKPMRIEKWIAFDGAIGVDIVDAAGEGQDDVAGVCVDAGIFMDEAPDGGDEADAAVGLATVFSDGISLFSNNTNTIEFEVAGEDVSLRLPIGMEVPIANQDGVNAFLPFWDGDVDYDVDSDLNVKDLFFEISQPSNGTLGFLTQAEADADYQAFLTKYGLEAGDKIVLVDTATHSMSNPVLSIYVLGTHGFTVGGQPSFVLYDTGVSLRIGLFHSVGESRVETLFESLSFRADPGETSADSFSVGVFYRPGIDLWHDNSTHLSDGPGGAFDSDNPKMVIEDATKECDEYGQVVGGDGEDEGEGDGGDDGDGDDGGGGEDGGGDDGGDGPGPVTPDPDPAPGEDNSLPDPDPDPDPGPVEEIVPPVVDPGSNAGDSEAGSADAGDGDSQSGDAQAEGDGIQDGDDGPQDGGAADADGVAYVHHEDVERDADAAAQSGQTLGSRGEDDARDEDGAGLDNKAVESAAVAAALELMRDAEAVFNTVRKDRMELETALSRLRDDYYSLANSERDAVRELLKRLFDTGNRELAAVVNVLEQMHSRVADYQQLPVDRRDGMLNESIRELLAGATKRSGEAGALCKALAEVSKLLESRRAEGGLAPTDADALAALFDKTHAAARDEWLLLAERSDPMGRDLERMEAIRK